MTDDLPWDRERVQALLPHRDPFLFVDAVVGLAADGLTATWCVPAEADWLRGHYPGQPVQPGVLTCEHVFQSAALHVARSLGGFAPEDGVPVLTRIQDARFRRMVQPGETLTTTVQVEERVGPAWYMSGRTTVDGARVLQVRFALTATGALARATAGSGGA